VLRVKEALEALLDSCLRKVAVSGATMQENEDLAAYVINLLNSGRPEQECLEILKEKKLELQKSLQMMRRELKGCEGL
jgi:hypothetical protein